MLYLALILLLTFLALTALLFVGTLLVQGALYETAQTDLFWRAPAAAAALTAYVGLWALLNYAAAEPGQTDLAFDSLFNFTTEKVSEPVREFEVVRGDSRVKYAARNVPGSPPRYEYRDGDGNLWSAARATDVGAILVKEDERVVTFKPVVKKGAEKERTVERFAEEGGRRYLALEGFGRIMTPRGGGSFVRVLLNVLHFAVWFVCLWLLLRFQWPHALGLAAALWLVMTFVAPPILRAGAQAKAPPPPAAQTSVTRRPEGGR